MRTISKAGGIKINTLGELDPNSVGVLDGSNGGLGIDMWSGTGQGLVARMLPGLTKPAAYPTARSLIRRLLLSAARPPLRGPSGGDAAKKAGGRSLMAYRLERLLAFGDMESAKNLIRVMPARMDEQAIAVSRMNAAFLMNDNAGACGEARARMSQYQGEDWLKALVFCHRLAGEGAKAAIGASLLKEQDVHDDAFFTLALMLGGNSDVTFSIPEKLHPLHLAMMRSARVQIPGSVVATSDPATLRTIAFSPNAALETRLDAAERAEALGAIKSEALAQLYGAVNFAPGDIEAALTGAEKLGGPRGRALLFHAARSQAVPAAQAEVLAKVFRLARNDGREATAIRAFLPLLAGLKATDDLSWLAADAARGLYFAGRYEQADSWVALARTKPYREMPQAGTAAGSSAGSVPEVSASADVKVWPLSVIAAAASDLTPVAALGAMESGSEGTTTESVAAVPVPDSMPGSSPESKDAAPVSGGSVSVLNLVTKKSAIAIKPGAGPAFDMAMFTRWQKSLVMTAPKAAQQTDNATAETTLRPQDGPQDFRAPLLLTLLEALGVDVPGEAWLNITVAGREAVSLPSTGLLAALAHAAKAGRVGETVLLSMVVLDGEGSDKVHPAVIGPVVRALGAIGFRKEARALAIEAAFGAGL